LYRGAADARIRRKIFGITTENYPQGDRKPETRTYLRGVYYGRGLVGKNRKLLIPKF